MAKIYTEKEAEDFLEKEGFKVAKRQLILNKEELKDIEKVRKIKFPWVMKISSKHIVHKAKIGGTILDIKTLEEAEKAFDKLKELNNFEGILVQEMIIGEELIIGLKKTNEFGTVIMFGKGGGQVEEHKDIAFRIPPLKEKEAEELIKGINFFKILEEKNVNIKFLKKDIVRMAKIAEKHREIQELDVNPLIANSKEAIVVDARVSFED